MTIFRSLLTNSHLPTRRGANFRGMQIATAPEVVASRKVSLLSALRKGIFALCGHFHHVRHRPSEWKARSPAVTVDRIAVRTRRTLVAVFDPAGTRIVAAWAM